MPVAGFAATDPIEVSGRYEYRTDELSREIIGDVVCFYPDATSKARVPQPASPNRIVWFCFSDTAEARKAMGISLPGSACGFTGTARLLITNYQRYEGEGDGHDVAELVRVVSHEPEGEIDCTDS